MAPPTERDRTFARLGEEAFDLLIVGGGITGVGVARDAALRGLKVALVEKADFASGTSSKSSKLVHGGLRYLEHAQFRLVFEGTNERALLMKLAPHLVRPLEFLMPVYKRDKPGLFVLDVGLWIYDGLSKFSSPKLHRTVRASRVLRLEPGLRHQDLEGGLLYYDCATDDARLTVENVIDARALGAAVLNYARAVKLLKDGEQILGAEIEDELQPARRVTVRAKVVVNATGPWCDEVRALAGEPGILHTSKGVHIIVDAERLRVHHAIVMKDAKRRVVFILPWGDRTVIGTTDTFYEDKPENVRADRADVAYLLELANLHYPAAKLTIDDVLATWAGLRPLLKPESAVASASDVSREHRILERPGLVTVAGGKLTTFRRMAAEVMEHVTAQLVKFGVDVPACTTEGRPFPGAQELPDAGGYASVQKLATELESSGAVDAVVAKHLAHTYGSRARGVVVRIQKDPALGARLDPEIPHVLAQVDVAVDDEQAQTLDDVLGRRVPLLLRARDQGLGAAHAVATRMASRLGWDPARTEGEIGRYRAIVDTTRQFRRE
jgi:glycerol-3-phosphate dehydrogenase